MKLISLITFLTFILYPMAPLRGDTITPDQSSPLTLDTVGSPHSPSKETAAVKNNATDTVSHNTCIINFSDRHLNHDDLADLMQAVDQSIEHGCTDILLVINSFGGKYSVGIATYNYLSNLPVTLRTHNIAATSSAAVLLYCAGDVRTASPNSHFLLHNGQLSPGSGLTVAEVEANYSIFQLQIGVMHEVIADCTNRPIRDIESLLNGTELLLDASSAEQFGLVEEIRDIGHDIANYDFIEFVGSSN